MTLNGNRIALVALALVLTTSSACMKQTSTGNPSTPTPNAAVIIALETAAAGCSVAAQDVDPAIGQWLTGACPTALNGIVQAVEANGAAAKIQSILATLKQTAATLPQTAKGISYVNQAISLAQTAFNTYLALTGQSTTTPPPAATKSLLESVPTRQRALAWTPTEKTRLDSLTAKLSGAK